MSDVEHDLPLAAKAGTGQGVGEIREVEWEYDEKPQRTNRQEQISSYFERAGGIAATVQCSINGCG